MSKPSQNWPKSGLVTFKQNWFFETFFSACEAVLEEHADDGHHGQSAVCDLSRQLLLLAALRSLHEAVGNTQEACVLEISRGTLGIVHLEILNTKHPMIFFRQKLDPNSHQKKSRTNKKNTKKSTKTSSGKNDLFKKKVMFSP